MENDVFPTKPSSKTLPWTNKYMLDDDTKTKQNSGYRYR